MGDTNEFPRKEAVALTGHEQPLRFQITDFFVPEADKSYKTLQRDPNRRVEIDYTKEPDEYRVLLYGCTLEGHSVCAEVTDYHPYFYLRIPEQFVKASPTAMKSWVNQFKTFLLETSYQDKRNHYDRQIISKRYKSHLVSVKYERKREFMGFTNNELFSFLKITVKSLALFQSLKYFFQNPPEEFLKAYKAPFKLYESNIDPMLRFIHDKGILPCGWVELPAKGYSLLANGCEDDSYCRTNFTVEVHHAYVKPLDWNTTAPLTIVSFDIECTSSHGDFPVASKDYLKLAKDLVQVAQHLRYTKEEVTEWIVRAYREDVVLSEDCKIHRLYPKDAVTEAMIRSKLAPLIDKVIYLMGEAKKDSGSGPADDDEEDITVEAKKMAYYETALRYELTGDAKKRKYNLPQLQGDAIIQIGTTVHRYGSDQIVYRNIITLNTCNPIEGVEVQAYKTEAEVLYAWKELIRRLDPDILMGYNIFGFDMPYVWERAMELDMDTFGVGLGRLTERECVLYEQRLVSAALGDNILKYFDMDGVVLVDMYKVMQRTPLDSYKLDFVAQLYLGDHKNDLKPMEIFEKFKGNSEDRKVIAEYCVQDCALVNRLFHKLKVLENNNAMGNVCLVPLSYLFMRGQGVKIFSLVAQFCKNENFAIPVIRTFREDMEEEDEVGYEGAIVLPPKEGMYLEDAITVLDYSSLYPSSMIERNLSHDCYVNDPTYDNLPGVDYMTVTYDIYEGKGDKKVKVSEKSCKFVQLPNKEKGVIPRILMKLLTQRKNTRKKIEYETVVTADGRSYSGLVKESGPTLSITDVEKKETWTVEVTEVVRREETYNMFEQAVFDALQLAYKVTANSLYGQIGSRVSPIYLKDIAACTTATGRERIMMAKKFVEDNYGAEVIYGDSVTNYTPILIRSVTDQAVRIETIDRLAELYGIMTWQPCREEGKQEKEYCQLQGVEVWSDNGWTTIQRVIRHTLAPHKKIIRVNTHWGVVDVTDDHSLLRPNGQEVSPKDLTLQDELCHAPYPNEIIKLHEDFFCQDSPQNSQSFMAMFQLLAERAGYHTSVEADTNTGSSELYRLTISKTPFLKNPTQITQMFQVPYQGFVYDLTTDNHHFQAGIGKMVVHNTDSIFCKFKFYDPNNPENPIKGRETLALGIAAGQRASREIKSILPEPQCLEYEKTFFPFIIFSKKRYVGLLYEDDPNKKPKQKSMGIVLKRRDNAPIVKKIYGGIIDILLNKYNLNESVMFLESELQKLVQGKYPLEDLIITKTLKGNYKDRSKIAHCVLADRIGERDPGNKPQINDRIPYIYIQTAEEVKLQGDRIESPDYIRENQLTPDFQFYITNQLMKPICQIYSLCVEKLPNYAYAPGYWDQWMEELKGNAIYKDSELKRKNRVDALREQEVESLLFSPFLEKKRKARALPSTEGPKGTKKKIAPKVLYTIASTAPKLTVEVIERKADKEAKKCACFLGEASFFIQDNLKLEKKMEIPKKSLKKVDAYNRVMYETLKEVIQTYDTELKVHGIQLQLNKTYARTLKTTMEEHDQIMEHIQKAEKDGDMEKYEQYSEMMRSLVIAHVINNYKYVFLT